MSHCRLLIEAECGELPRRWREVLIPGQMAKLREGEVCAMHDGKQAVYYLHHLTDEHGPYFRLSTEEAAMAKQEWGPPMWDDIHSSCRHLAGDEIHMYLLLILLALPCGECKQHFGTMLEEEPVDTTSPLAYLRSTWGWHNRVNRRKGKMEMPWEECVARYGASMGS